jgi:hypothetical protein
MGWVSRLTRRVVDPYWAGCHELASDAYPTSSIEERFELQPDICASSPPPECSFAMLPT